MPDLSSANSLFFCDFVRHWLHPRQETDGCVEPPIPIVKEGLSFHPHQVSVAPLSRLPYRIPAP
jgi:hypothetical protein